ncbi:hypothetical protein [Blastomonas sp. AAP53]|uniref:hypothetical protein n=1 Tax=Blastomonas sp. AAP53 TaxID=1248760 RepID=UPI000304A245|nr:hypothetical protein [Blastomonas sp. AAP53]
MKRTRHTIRLRPELARELAEFAARKRVSQAAIVEAALSAFLSPEGPERLEAAFSRRLDRISKQIDKLGYHVEVGNESLAVFVLTWLTSNPPLPPEQRPAAQAQAKKRFEAFIDAVARRMESDQRPTQ